MGFATREERDWHEFTTGEISHAIWERRRSYYNEEELEHLTQLMIEKASKYESATHSVMLDDGTIHIFPEKREHKPVYTVAILKDGVFDKDLDYDGAIELLLRAVRENPEIIGPDLLTQITNGVAAIYREADDG